MADHPLTELHLVELNRGLAAINDALRQIDLASRAGIDMSEAKKEADDARSTLLKIKQVYFPGR